MRLRKPALVVSEGATAVADTQLQLVPPHPLPAVSATAKVTERHLDEAVGEARGLLSEVKAAGTHTATLYWRLAGKLAEIEDRQLWKLRAPREDGQPAWHSFESFCRGEIGIGPSTRRALLQVARDWSEADVLAHGWSKLRLLSSIPAHERAESMKRLEGGATKRQLEEHVRTRPKSDGTPRTPRPPAKRVEPQVTKAEVDAEREQMERRHALSDRVTVVALLKRYDPVPLELVGRGQEKMRARLELENGVSLYATLDRAGADVVFEFVREDAES